MGGHMGTRQNRNDSIGLCYDDAIAQGYTMFGVQFGGECWSGDKIELTYSKYGGTSRCKNGVGGSWANDAYLVSKYHEYTVIYPA